jgi:hypothetical protein
LRQKVHCGVANALELGIDIGDLSFDPGGLSWHHCHPPGNKPGAGRSRRLAVLITG